MTDITPGYDFGVNEVPRAETLLLQATGLQITNVSVDSLDAAIVGIKSGDASAVTDSLRVGDTVGSMWVSPFGDIWVQEASGPVILNRVMGGWETRSVFTAQDTSFPNHLRPGSLVQQDSGADGTPSMIDTSRVEGDTRTTGITAFRLSDSGSYEDSRGGFHFGITQGESAASQYHRVLYRGLTIYSDRDDTNAQARSKLSDMQNGFRLKSPQGLSSTPMMEANYFHASPAWKHFGTLGMPADGASKVSDAAIGNHEWRQEWMIWAFGSWSWMNKT